MHNGFRSFAELLAPPAETATATDTAEHAQQALQTASHEECACVQTLRDVRLFRAHVAEAVDASVQLLLQDIAADVLARELQIAPADIAAIVQRVITRFDADEPLRVRVSQSEHAVDVDIPLLIDPELRAGDAIIEFASGSVDARLGTRLACVLETLT